ncbi:MAG: guanylate kinase [Planctomycetota bacterium]|nr:guanylate kinase [Planctomycetota bacterium]
MDTVKLKSVKSGKLVIISGPSGAGKSTVLKHVLAECSRPLELSVSVTTRHPRPGETDRVDYRFVSKDDFARRRDNDEFLEWKEVFKRGDYYGTLRNEVAAGLAAGKWVVLEIDVEGAMMVLESHPDAITIFLHPGSDEELERRLRDRATETEDSIQRRLEVARREMACRNKYNHEVVNNTVDQAVEDICHILASGE